MMAYIGTMPPCATVIDREDIYTIIIGTPTDNHVDLMMWGVKAGKAVLCEKPIDLSLATVGEAVAKIERHDALATIAFNRRFALRLAECALQSAESSRMIAV
jgi:myo-inositol 2-dehydrogenase/D-chiro-inositol 1-dehydrogenase